MPNRRRGEVALQLGGTRYTLCLTLGALAELEDAFGVQDLMALADRFGTGRLSSRDLLTVLAVALRGGGHAMSDGEVANLPLHDGIEPVAAALADLLVLTFGGGEASPNPPWRIVRFRTMRHWEKRASERSRTCLAVAGPVLLPRDPPASLTPSPGTMR